MKGHSRTKKKKAKNKLLRNFLLLVGAGAFGALFVGTLVIFYFLRDLPSVDLITTRQVAQSTKIYDRTGEVPLYEISGEQKRTIIPLEEIPKFAKDATIAIEDEQFYEGPGIDWRGILRALWVNVTRGKIVQGGSTITQQLARNAFLTLEQKVSRKIKEVILAVQLTRRYSKDEILWFYLNEIPYGSTIYGIESASRAYFNKPAQELTLAESAILAALPRAPTYYSPWGSHTNELIERQRFILEKMFRLGTIDKEQLDAALQTKISFAPHAQEIKAPHFVIAVQDHLVQKYGEDLVRTGGLRVITTLDTKLQELAEKVVLEGALRNEELYQGKNAALVAQDARTGQVLAMVGSRDYFDAENEGNFNVATQGLRQPGSALKPFSYLAAFQKGYTPDTVLFDLPTEFASNNPDCPTKVDFTDTNDECYHPENFDGEFRGPVTMRQGLGQSINVPSVKTLYLAGLDDTLETVKNFGITTLTDRGRYGLSLVLGGGEVKLVELVGAYSVLAQEGVRHEQNLILEVRDAKGNIIESYLDKSERVIGEQPVRLVNDVLTDTETRAGLFQNSLSLTIFPDHEVALKTGTTNDYRDAWAIGYAPSFVVGVWAGNNDNAPMQQRGSSILAAVPIWHAFMKEALKDRSPETFIRPSPLTVEKPILRGDFLANNQVHSILFYVNRRDPLAPQPANPSLDSQFANWEEPILEWAKTNPSNFERFYNQLGLAAPFVRAQTPRDTPQVTIHQPLNGTYVQNRISLVADISARSTIAYIRVYFNNQLVREFRNFSSSIYQLSWVFTPVNPPPQNLLRVEAADSNNRVGSAEAILYR